MREGHILLKTMPRYFALLRGINVGNHLVKMEVLRKVFVSMGFTNVETVIASGNVVFESSESPDRKLEETIERALKDALGYEVATFLRSVPEMTSVLKQQPFNLAGLDSEVVVYAAFLRSKPSATLRKALSVLNTEINELRVKNREVYWLRRERGKDSELFSVRFGKILGSETTVRNMNTVKRIVAKYC
jgi:uncharacterized protein (DUF1697 family)